MMFSFEPRICVGGFRLLVGDSSPLRGDQQNKLSK